MAIVRVRSDVCSAVWVDAIKTNIALNPDSPFDEDDDVVREFGWAFVHEDGSPVDRGIERATAKPGEKRR